MRFGSIVSPRRSLRRARPTKTRFRMSDAGTVGQPTPALGANHSAGRVACDRAHHHPRLRPGRRSAGPPPRRAGPLRRRRRPGPGLVPQARTGVQRPDRHGGGIRPPDPRERRHHPRARVRGGEQRRQQQHPRRAGGAGDLRRGAGRRAHLRPPSRRGVPAPRHPHRGDGLVDHGSDHAADPSPRRPGRVPRPQRHRHAGRGPPGPGLARQAVHHAGGGLRGPRRLHHPRRRRH